MDNIYSQGVASDGPVILCDGLPMTPDMIVEVLNRYVKRIKELEAVKKYTECWNDYQKQFAGITLKNGKLEEENQRLRDAIIESIQICGSIEGDDIGTEMLKGTLRDILQKALEE